MKYLPCLILFFSLSLHSIAQKTKKPVKRKGKVTVKAPAASQTALDAHLLQPGQAFAYDLVKGSLGKTDPQDADKNYYDTYTLSLNEGEELRLEAATDWYRIAIALESPDKQVQTRKDTDEFPGFSIQKLSYKVPATGTYQLKVSSTDPNSAGEYIIRKFLLPATLVLPNEQADFCERVNFLLAQHQDHFEQIKGKKTKTDKKAGITDHYQTAFAFLPGKPSEILFETEQEKTKYQTILGEFTTREQARQLHQQYVSQLKGCLSGWEPDELSGEKFEQFGVSSYTDFMSLTLKEVGKKKFQVILGLD